MHALAWLSLAAPVLVVAQDPTAQANEAKYRAKLREPFVAQAEWVQSFEEAQRLAKEKRMLIFGYFTRSYAP